MESQQPEQQSSNGQPSIDDLINNQKLLVAALQEHALKCGNVLDRKAMIDPIATAIATLHTLSQLS